MSFDQTTNKERLGWPDRYRMKRFMDILPAFAFLLVVLYVNRDLFRSPIIEDGDFAANAIQVQNAKHFQETLGNYSRWHFHHPGPVVFYLYALGEFVFYDVLHLVPAPINAHILVAIIANVFFLFASIAIIRTHSSHSFIPVAILLTVLFIYVVNKEPSYGENPNGALVSAWIPHILLFCFLFFLTACASVAAGRISHLPLLCFAGMFLVHAHVAQILFVSSLFLATCCAAWFSELRFRNHFIRQNKQTLLISGGITPFFALPILADLLLHNPNNLYAIRTYLRFHRSETNSLLVAARYYWTFLRFTRNPEVAVLTGFHGIPVQKYVWIYWTLFTLMAALALLLYLRRREALDRFFLFVGLGTVAVSLLFLVWGMRITGLLYRFNGSFIYSIQLLLFLAVAALLLKNLRQPSSMLAGIVAPLFIFLASPQFRNTYQGDPNVLRAALEIPADHSEPVRLVFAPSEWPFAIGVASRMKRSHKIPCVSLDWEFMFGAERACRDSLTTRKMVFIRMNQACASPCRPVFQDRDISVQIRPYEAKKFPLRIGLEDTFDEKDGFYEGEETHRWSQKVGVIRFFLANDFSQASRLRLQIHGVLLPGRPVGVFLNDRLLGTITGEGFRSEDFFVAPDAFRTGTDNKISFVVENAGPVGADPRMLGYGFSSLQIEEAISESPGDREAK